MCLDRSRQRQVCSRLTVKIVVISLSTRQWHHSKAVCLSLLMESLTQVNMNYFFKKACFFSVFLREKNITRSRRSAALMHKLISAFAFSYDSLFQNINFRCLTIFCGPIGYFVSNLIGKPKRQVSRIAIHTGFNRTAN